MIFFHPLKKGKEKRSVCFFFICAVSLNCNFYLSTLISGLIKYLSWYSQTFYLFSENVPMAYWDEYGPSKGIYREACPASVDGWSSPLQRETSDTIKRGQSTMVCWVWIPPGQAAQNRYRLKAEDSRTDFCSPKHTQHTQNLWMVGSCSWEQKINLLGIHTCTETIKIRAPREIDPKTVIAFTFWGNVFMLSILADGCIPEPSWS